MVVMAHTVRIPCYSLLPDPCAFIRVGADHLNSGSRLQDGALRVVFRIVFVMRAIVGDTAHDFLRVVASRKGAFGVRPIRF